MKLENIFMFGNEYIDYLEKEKETRTLLWYEKLYIWYYNNFEYIIIILGLVFLGLIFYNDYYLKKASDNKQKKIQKGSSLKLEGATTTSSNNSISTKAQQGNQAQQVNQAQQAKQEAQKPEAQKQEAQKQEEQGMEGPKGDGKDGKPSKYGATKAGLKETGSSVKKGAKFGKGTFNKLNKAGKAVGSKLGSAGSSMKNSFMANTGDIYKFFFTVFLTFAIGVFILPTVVLAGLGFLTFLITKKHLIKMFTL